MHRFAWIVALMLSFAGLASAQSNLSEVQRLVAAGGDDEDFAGHAVAISGNTAVVGAPGFTDEETDQGAAYVWERSPATNLWSPVKQLLASDAGFDNFFGSAVGIDGDRIVVSAPGNDIGFEVDAGAVYVFERDAGGADNWGEVAQLTGSLAGGARAFGSDVDVSGNTIVASEPETDGVGNVFVFTRDPFGDWVETRRLSPPDDFLYFGRDVDLDGDQLLVAAPRRSGSGDGRAYVHARDQGGAGNWGLVATLSVDSALAAEFAEHAAIHGDTAVVGDTATGNAESGKVFVFQRDQGGPNAWGFLKAIEPAGNPEEAGFGREVAIRGDRILAKGNSPATATTFGRNQGGPNNWGELQTLTLGGTTTLGGFFTFFGGSRLALTGGGLLGETAIIGEPRGDTGNPDQGFAYIFGNTQPRPILGDVSGAIGGGDAVVLIGSIEDGEQGAETLIARVNGGESATVNGVTLSNLAIGSDGAVTANVDVACGASDASFELSFADAEGLVATASLTIEAAPSEPPALQLASPGRLWPPSPLYWPVPAFLLVESATDDCDGNLRHDVVIEQVTSDEPDDAPGLLDGRTRHDIIAPFCEIAFLRAERNLAGNGRVYGVTLRVRDSEGNETRAVFPVGVPITRRGTAVEDAPAQTVDTGCP